MLRLSVFFGGLITGLVAEIFDLKGYPVPDNLTLSTYYVFYVYATPVQGQTGGNASVTFKNFDVKWADGQSMPIGSYASLQASIVPWSKFFNLVDKLNFCTADRQVAFIQNKLLPPQTVPVFNVGTQVEATFPISETGEYVVTVTNCGDRTGATFLGGQVIVAQPHGFLPGNKIWTLQWWGCFAIVNAFLSIAWTIVAARHSKSLVYVQKVITAVAAVAFLEAVLAYFQYREWNATGVQNIVLLFAMMLAYSLKYVLTLRMLIETAAGAGVTMTRLETRVELKMDAVCSIFLAAQWIWKVILSYKYRFMINPMFSLAITIPGTLLWLILFIWVNRRFHSLLTQLQDKQLASAAVKLFVNMRLVLASSILLATVVLGLQLIDILLPETPWNLQWVPYDAAPHSVFTLFLLAIMILWWPHEDSWKLGYAEQVTQDENTEAEGQQHRATPEQIGAGEEL